ncbi:hypothetical protein D9615_009931 [Tricholomella constricta]|uniref:C2H2-type domain-containing protein n=1 Tax=Tricholomella constricta TaxID=117010 RepID=A0A8H5GZS9_9AGAR|nr:hypothetical protein D9615_009931 [Tricholomella constricta]
MHRLRKKFLFAPKVFACPYPDCRKRCTRASGLRQHISHIHEVPTALRPPQNAHQRPVTPPPPPDAEEGNNQPSPTFSSRRSPRRTPTGSPRRPLRQNIPDFLVNAAGLRIEKHPLIDGSKFDADGYELNEEDPPPPPRDPPNPTDYFPFSSRAEFELSELLYVDVEMREKHVDRLMHTMSALYNQPPPMSSHSELHSIIDHIGLADVQWDSFSVEYDGPRPADGQEVPVWMTTSHQIWFRDPLKVLESQLANPTFNDKIDYAPKKVTKGGKRRYKNLMSGKWAWAQADIIGQDPQCHGAMFAPVILGSDKTTVSVATGQNDFYPLYASSGNVFNSVRRGHKNAVALIGFLAIPKSSSEYTDKEDYRKFRRQLFHTSLERILSSLRPHMEEPRLTYCGDGYYRRVIYGLGPYIADYPEQALLACVVQGWCPKCTAYPEDLDDCSKAERRSHQHTEKLVQGCSLVELWDGYGIVGELIPFTKSFPRADIHELLAPDLLHQIIKGTFKDHLVDWVTQYIKMEHPKQKADEILADIDRRIASVPPFPGLRHFNEGRGFKQWTGNDSKGLMKVYLPAIAGHVPDQMVQAVAALIEFCYLVRRDVIDDDTIATIEAALHQFHTSREIFRDVGVRPDGFSLPRQHSLKHYVRLIKLFGAPNGLCSSITENKHIKAVKRAYRRSNKYKPLGQMLLTNQRLDKLAAARVDFTTRGMLDGPGLPEYLLPDVPPPPLPPPQLPPMPDDDECQELGAVNDPESQVEITLAKRYVRKVPTDIYGLARHLNLRCLPELTRRYLYDVENPDAPIPGTQVPTADLPHITGTMRIYTSARAVFYAPSDLSGIGGLHHERIRATRSWYGGPARYDCVFVGNGDARDAPGFAGLNAARVRLFFCFEHKEKAYPCALIHWFSHVGNMPDPVTGLWRVQPDFDRSGRPVLAVIALDAIMRGAHLIGVSGQDSIPRYHFDRSKSLDSFKTFYVNKYADHHAHEVVY